MELTTKRCPGCGEDVLYASVQGLGTVALLDPEPVWNGCWEVTQHGVTRHVRSNEQPTGLPRFMPHYGTCREPAAAAAAVGVL